MNLNARRIGMILSLGLLSLLAWHFWPHKPKLEEFSEIGKQKLVGVREPHSTSEIVGIGAALKWDSDYDAPQIAQVLPNSPALRAGLSPGLIIQRIDFVNTKGTSLAECVGLIRGPEGIRVRLEVVDPGLNETNVVELTRQRVEIQSHHPHDLK